MHIHSVYMHVFRHVRTWERAESDQSPEHQNPPPRDLHQIYFRKICGDFYVLFLKDLPD